MKMKSRLVQLCMNASTWSMVAILELGCIRVKGDIIRIMTGIRREGKQNFIRSKNGCAQEDVHIISRLIVSIVD